MLFMGFPGVGGSIGCGADPAAPCGGPVQLGGVLAGLGGPEVAEVLGDALDLSLAEAQAHGVDDVVCPRFPAGLEPRRLGASGACVAQLRFSYLLSISISSM